MCVGIIVEREVENLHRRCSQAMIHLVRVALVLHRRSSTSE